MPKLDPYEVVINGHRTTLLLTEDAAAAHGLTPAPTTEQKARATSNKATRTSTK